MSSHIFALHTSTLHESLSQKSQGQELVLYDMPCWQRITKVLRLDQGQVIILFDGNHIVQLKLSATTFTQKNMVVGIIESVRRVQPLTPRITLYAAILKKNAFENVIYTAAQMGVQTIVPLITARTQQEWIEAIAPRFEAMMVAACEQSKQYAIPHLAEPMHLRDLMSLERVENERRIFFEADQQPLSSLVSDPLYHNESLSLSCLIGPEGGLTSSEQEDLRLAGFEGYCLTPSILRAIDATIVALGAIRSLLGRR